MPTRNVVLTDRQEKLIESLVQAGRYQNASEVLRDGLRLLEQRDAEDAARLVALREAASAGIADIERGDYKEFSSARSLVAYLREQTEPLLDDKSD
jgi:antitoxin ParD1/3/4